MCCNPFPAGIFRPIQIQYIFIVVVLYQLFGRNIPSNTNTICIYCSFLLSGRNIPSNTNTIHIPCCCVVSTFRPEHSVQYKYNTHWLFLMCCIHFPAGIFRPIQIQYTFFVVVLHQLSGRNIPSNTNTIHILRCCVASTFRPEYSVQYKYNTQLLLLCCNPIPAGIFRPIQIQYTFFVVVLHQLSGRNIPSNTNTIHIDCF